MLFSMDNVGVRVHEVAGESEYCTDPMCARYQTPGQAVAERYWQLIESLWNFEASWRVLPTQQIPTVLAGNGVTTGRMMRWGLIPYSGESAYPLINATVEKVSRGEDGAEGLS